MQRSKAYRAAAEKVDQDKLYTPAEAVRLAKETSSTKYDATVEVAFRLGIDPRKADQLVRGTVNLPHGTGKTARVLVFAVGPRAQAAIDAGADEVGGEEPACDARRLVGDGADLGEPRVGVGLGQFAASHLHEVGVGAVGGEHGVRAAEGGEGPLGGGRELVAASLEVDAERADVE